MATHFRVWGVIGKGNTGKSTVIGNLISTLGRGAGGFRHIRLRGGGYLYVYARRQSVQEANRSPQQVVADAVRNAGTVQRNSGIAISYMNLLMAIRSDAGINGHPAATVYLSDFVKAGWTTESLALTDEDEKDRSPYYEFGAPFCEVADATTWVRGPSSHQWLVSQVRNHFGWA
jgi:hypothetical protein